MGSDLQDINLVSAALEQKKTKKNASWSYATATRFSLWPTNRKKRRASTTAAHRHEKKNTQHKSNKGRQAAHGHGIAVLCDGRSGAASLRGSGSTGGRQITSISPANTVRRGNRFWPPHPHPPDQGHPRVIPASPLATAWPLVVPPPHQPPAGNPARQQPVKSTALLWGQRLSRRLLGRAGCPLSRLLPAQRQPPRRQHSSLSCCSRSSVSGPYPPSLHPPCGLQVETCSEWDKLLCALR